VRAWAPARCVVPGEVRWTGGSGCGHVWTGDRSAWECSVCVHTVHNTDYATTEVMLLWSGLVRAGLVLYCMQVEAVPSAAERASFSGGRVRMSGCGG
jgi:hypothetical protein